jgi:hypothetical protein
MARKWRVFSTGVQTVLKPEWQMTALLNCIDYKLHGRRTALLIGVNLSQNPSKISFPGRTWKCRLSGSAVSKQGRASQWYSQSLTGNKAILKSRFQVLPGNALGAALPQVTEAAAPEWYSQSLTGNKASCPYACPQFSLHPTPVLSLAKTSPPQGIGEGIKGRGKINVE